ncbi:MAG: alpha/beta hydrolase [Propionibacteriaceae bacterium]|jgi:acetyl esterase/lipase|nr:alpha/beta hydrolase [Propionibacteriaceae bacterium]
MELQIQPAPGGYGFVVVLPGGGYRHRAEHETYPPMEWLAERGWRCGALPYTVDPSGYPQALMETLTAVAEVRAGKYGPIHGPVGMLGFSAGGHLAGLAATATAQELEQASQFSGGLVTSRPDFTVLAYPVVTMGEHAHLGSRESLFAGLEGGDWIDRLSVEKRVDAATGPMFMWTMANDEAVPAQNCLMLTQACIDHAVPVELQVYPHGHHGMGMTGSDQVDAAWAAAALWLRQIRAGAWLRDVTVRHG